MKLTGPKPCVKKNCTVHWTLHDYNLHDISVRHAYIHKHYSSRQQQTSAKTYQPNKHLSQDCKQPAQQEKTKNTKFHQVACFLLSCTCVCMHMHLYNACCDKCIPIIQLIASTFSYSSLMCKKHHKHLIQLDLPKSINTVTLRRFQNNALFV